MIRDIPAGASFTFGPRGRVGDALSVSLAFNPITAGIGAATGLATAALSSWMNSIQLSHDADTATTLIVNGLAAQLQNLVNAYLSEPVPSCASQRAALDAYDQAIVWLQGPQACGNPSYGSAGNRCISDRIGSGAKFPWDTYYRDPIANDPRLTGAGCDTGQDVILPSLSTGTYVDTGVTSTGGSSTGPTPAQIAAAAVAATPATSTTAAAGIPAAYLWIAAALAGAWVLAKEL